MSEAIRCDYCKESKLLSDATDWWRIEPVRAYQIGDEEGGDFCSDRCASNFFLNRHLGDGSTPTGKQPIISLPDNDTIKEGDKVPAGVVLKPDTGS